MNGQEILLGGIGRVWGRLIVVIWQFVVVCFFNFDVAGGFEGVDFPFGEEGGESGAIMRSELKKGKCVA